MTSECRSTHKLNVHNEAIEGMLCNQDFTQCDAALNIKSVLEEYNKIINDKNEKSEYQMSTAIEELINKKLFNGSYSNVKLLNDFFHLKYNHNINDNAKQFNKFYKFLSNYNDTLSCDTTYCKGYNRYYRNREEIINQSEMKENMVYSYNLVCRIHTFFVHSYERNRLTEHEITYIEQQLNLFKQNSNCQNEEQIHDKNVALIATVLNAKKQNSSLPASTIINHSKYITSDYESLNCIAIVQILNHNGVYIAADKMQNIFDKYGYHKQQLISDLCDEIGNYNQSAQNVLLCYILTNELQLTEHEKRQKIYDLILHNYVDKAELNNDNFVKILLHTASILYPIINTKEIEHIAMKENLNGKIFVKGTNDFTNSTKFATMFKSIHNYNKKKLTNIYRTINKWKPKTYQITPSTALDEIKSPQQQEMINCVEEDLEHMSDTDLLNLFCTITKADKLVTEPFLIESNWIIDDAINKYYALSGDVKKLSTKYENHIYDKPNEDALIYNEGIKFWYWKPRNKDEERCYIKNKHKNLKDEILNTG
eukprot:365916_1